MLPTCFPHSLPRSPTHCWGHTVLKNAELLTLLHFKTPDPTSMTIPPALTCQALSRSASAAPSPQTSERRTRDPYPPLSLPASSSQDSWRPLPAGGNCRRSRSQRRRCLRSPRRHLRRPAAGCLGRGWRSGEAERRHRPGLWPLAWTAATTHCAQDRKDRKAGQQVETVGHKGR